MVYSILVMFPSPDSGSVADLDVKLSGVATCCLVSRLQPNYPSHFLPGCWRHGVWAPAAMGHRANGDNIAPRRL